MKDKSRPPSPVLRKACLRDVDSISTLINSNAKLNLLLPKSRFKIISSIMTFSVAEENGKIIGCAALNPLWTDLGEVMSLCVAEEARNRGIGSALVAEIKKEAIAIGFPKLMALTYQLAFFKNQGFSEADKNTFPRKIWRECMECPKLENCDETAVVLDLQNKEKTVPR
jgi:amino-acid N-acetyltransferase